MTVLYSPEVIELAAAFTAYPSPPCPFISGDSMSALSLPLPLNVPSLAFSFCLEDDGPLLVCGLGGSEAVRDRDMNSVSLLERFGFGEASRSGGWGMGCLSCDVVDVEKRFALANGESVLEFISCSCGGV